MSRLLPLECIHLQTTFLKCWTLGIKDDNNHTSIILELQKWMTKINDNLLLIDFLNILDGKKINVALHYTQSS